MLYRLSHGDRDQHHQVLRLRRPWMLRNRALRHAGRPHPIPTGRCMMLPGQYVNTDDDQRAWQVASINGPTRSWAGLETPPAVYTLVDPLTREVRRVVTPAARPVNTAGGTATPVAFTLTSACEACDVPAGFCYGTGHHYRSVLASA